MSKLVKEVLSISSRSKGRNTWKVLTTRGTDGKEHQENLIVTDDRDLQSRLEGIFTSPGKYEIDYSEKGEYWSIVGAAKLNGHSSPPPAASASVAPAGDRWEASLRIAVQVVTALLSSKSPTFDPKTLGEVFEEVVSCARVIYNTDLSNKQAPPGA